MKCVFCVRQKVEEMLAWSADIEEARRYALLFLFSYSFLLRTPSEALPAVAGTDGREEGSNSVLFKDGEQLVLILRRRKNKPAGSRLVRMCYHVYMSKSPASCAYHLLGPQLDATAAGGKVFDGITASGVFVDRWGPCVHDSHVLAQVRQAC